MEEVTNEVSLNLLWSVSLTVTGEGINAGLILVDAS